MPVESNSRLIYAAKQTAKGTPNATPTVVFPLSGDGALNPNREIIQLPETDASAQRSDSVVVGASPGGGWTGWLRATHMKVLAEGIMGSAAVVGGASTATPTKTMPYYTMFDVIPGKQCTQYNDVRLASLTVGSEALQGAPYSVQAVALSAILGAAEPTLALPTDVKYGHSYVKVTIGGVWPGTHDSISITINRNVTVLRGDMGLAAYDSHPGLFEVSLEGIRKIYETDADYRKIHGGSAAATVLTRTVFAESLSILYEESAARSVEFVSSGIEYVEHTQPVATDGSPLLQTLRSNTLRQAVWANNLTIISKYA